MSHYPHPTPPNSRIAWNESSQAWVLWHYEDVVAILKDERFSAVSPDGAAMPEAFSKETHRKHRQQFTSLLQQNFEGASLQMKTQVEQLCQQLKNRNTWDLQGDFIKPWCQKIALSLLDFEPKRLAELQAWADAVFYMLDSDECYEKGTTATIELAKYFQEKIFLRLQNPSNDLLSNYLQNKEASDVWVAHLIQFWVGFCTSLPLLLGNIVLALSIDATQKNLYLQDPSAAVSELLRFASPVHRVYRAASESIDFGGHHFAQGDRLALLLSQANRDALVFDNPNLLEVLRTAAPQLTLGRGMHACLAAPLIREAIVLLPMQLFSIFPNVVLDYSSLGWGGSTAIKGVDMLIMRNMD